MLSTDYKNNFAIDTNELESLITENKKLMINSPNNPSEKIL